MRKFWVSLAAVAAAALFGAHVGWAAPVAVPGDDPASGWAAVIDEGSSVTLAGPVAGMWSTSGGTGTCTFGSPTAATTTFSCNDDGPRTVTLTTPAGVVTDHLLVRNVAPTATLSVPALTGVTRPTAAQLTIADAGANDSFSCWIDWGDGTGSFQGTPSNGACAGTHLYSLVGPHWAVAHVLDDDGGFANSNEVLVVVKAPPTIGAGSAPASAKEGETFSVSAIPDGASDVSWSASGGTGTCTFASPASAATSVTCNDNGTYLLTATATDVVGQTSTTTATVQVANVAPTLTVATTVSGMNTSVSGSVADAGANDSLACSIAWGDGSTSAAPASGGTCTASHTYTGTVISQTITVSASDDDGGTAGASANVTLAPSVQTALGLQQLALVRLRVLRTGATGTDAVLLDSLLQSLQDALLPARWLTAMRVSESNGSRVFSDDELVASKLTSTEIRAALVQATSLLARTAIADAKNVNGSRAWIAVASAALAHGDAEFARGDATRAIDAYGVAWKTAAAAS
jgi:hypothetical protein